MRKHQVLLRFPKTLVEELDNLSANLGLTRTDILRTAIIMYLDQEQIADFQVPSFEEKYDHRITINLTEILYQIVHQKAQKYDSSVNAMIIFAADSLQKHYAQFLEGLAN